MIAKLSAYFTFFGGGFAFVMFLGQLVRRRRSSHNYYLAALFFCLGVMLTSFGMDQVGLFLVYPHWTLLITLSIPLLGPLLYVFFGRTLGVREERRRLIHIWPAPLMFALLSPVIFRSHEFKHALYSRNLYTEELRFFRVYHDAVFALIMIIMIFYLVALLRRLSFLWDMGSLQREKSNRTGLAFVFLAILNIVLYLIAQTFHVRILFRIAYIMTTTMLILIYLVGQRHPEYMDALRTQAARARYEKSRIRGLDVQAIVRRLNELMENEKLYSDEDLTLASTARELSVSPHQLSQILNEQLSKSFKNFVNEYRVQAAREMLLREPDRTVLSVSAAAGFNSKSSFNAVFRTITGVTPSEFRRRSASG